MMKIFYLLLLTTVLVLSGCGGASDVEQKQTDVFPFPCKTRDRAYYVDKDGNETAGLNQAIADLNLGRWWEPVFFCDGLLRIDKRRDDGQRVCLFLDDKGNVVLDVMKSVFAGLFDEKPEYARCSDFSRGIAFVKSGSLEPKVYAINKKGEVLYEFEGIPTTGFNESGEAFFRAPNGDYGVMNDKGKVVVEPSRGIVPSDNLPPVKGCVVASSGNGVGLMSYDGKYVVEPLYSCISVLDANDNVVFTRFDGTVGIADKSGNVLCETDYSSLVNDGKWYYFTTKGDEVGWCDEKGEVKIGPLRRSEEQSVRGRYEWYPNMFYGSPYSVGTQTTVGEDGNYRFASGCLSVASLEDKTGHGGTYFFEPDDATADGIVFITPVVNGRVVGMDPGSKTGRVYRVDGNKLTMVSPQGFYPKYGHGYLNIIGRMALNPTYGWKGVDK